MTNEEVVEYAKNIAFCNGCPVNMSIEGNEKACDVCEHREFFETVIDCFSKQAIKEKASDKYRVHDLRKDPYDLPKKDRLIIATDGEDFFCGKTVMRFAGIALQTLLYSKDGYCVSEEDYISGSDLIMWKYYDYSKEFDRFQEDV